jgi:O-methyltransferase domain
VLRALASIGVFAERADGHFELTPLASTLRSDVKSSLRPFALSYGEAWWWDGFREMLHSVATGQTGFSRAHGAELFEYLDQHREHAMTFNANMSAMTQGEAQAVIEGYDFSSTKVLADVGGGLGTFACAVLLSQPSARAIVFDQPSVIGGGPAAVAPLGLLDRLEFVGGSFFDAVPAGADVYCLKDILHDWDDDQCVRILGSVRQAMTKTTRLLVIERVIPPGNEPFAGKMVDITMLVMTGGRERTAEEYSRLFDSAGLTLTTIASTSSGSSVIEAVIG